ncbi:MAG TPA: diadenylate cyclase CdaA [Candidatus Sulfotelmatobacter sp.]
MSPIITSWTQGAWVALDILLVALLIYQVLVMIRGTRAVAMLVGLLVVATTFYFARIGELTTLNWVVSNVLPYVVFALIVVFQSEIRHVLADLGRRLTIFGGSSSDGGSYDDIVLAANLFSQHQTGALIVIEREIGLRTHIESGVPLDARLSYDLLATIFRPSAPLHDGAVIVQKDRIAAAACFLPLSMNPLLSTQLGTRHRAGIGITEETDAIAVICSEETGAISLAVGGRIERDLSVEQLRDRLGSELRRRIIPVTLPTPIARPVDDESDAALDSPLSEPAPQHKTDSGPNRESNA